MIFKSKKQSQSWEDRFGFSYFQNCTSYLQNFYSSYARKNLDDIQMLGDLPLAQERLDVYLEQIFKRTRSISQVQQQASMLFNPSGAAFLSWNEIGQICLDIFQILGIPIQIELLHANQGFELKQSYLSGYLLGLAVSLIDYPIPELTILIQEDGIQCRGEFQINSSDLIISPLQAPFKELQALLNLELTTSVEDTISIIDIKLKNQAK